MGKGTCNKLLSAPWGRGGEEEEERKIGLPMCACHRDRKMDEGLNAAIRTRAFFSCLTSEGEEILLVWGLVY